MRLFVLCVLAIVVMALLSCRKVETVSVLEMRVHTLLMSVHMRLVLVWALQPHEMCWMGKGLDGHSAHLWLTFTVWENSGHVQYMYIHGKVCAEQTKQRRTAGWPSSALCMLSCSVMA